MIAGSADRAVRAALPVIVVLVVGLSLWLLTATHMEVRRQAERAEQRADRITERLLAELRSPDVDEIQETLDRIVELLEE